MKEKAKDPRRVAAAKRAWVTIRAKNKAELKTATSKPTKPKAKAKTRK